MAWLFFSDGRRIGGTRILRMDRPTNDQATTRYLVACLHCGEEFHSTHRALMDRRAKGRDRCAACRRNRVREVRPPQGIIRAGVHDWWPLKGTMGGRHDAEIGTGKET